MQQTLIGKPLRRSTVQCLLIALLVAAGVRVAVFIGSAFHPIPAADGMFASPFNFFGSDIAAYSYSAELIFDRPFAALVDDVVKFAATGEHKAVEFLLVLSISHFE